MKIDASDLTVGRPSKAVALAILFGGLGAICFTGLLYWFTAGYWASLGLLVPCALLAFATARFRDNLSVQWIAASVTAYVLSAGVLIVVIAWNSTLSPSMKFLACALFVLLMVVVATASALGGNELRRLSRLTEAEKEERARKEQEKKTRSEIDMTAFFLGALGVFRTCSLLSINPFIDVSQSTGKFWLLITGPVLIAAALSVHFTRFFAFCVIGCVLCLVTANPIAILICIVCLVTLFKSDVLDVFERGRKTAPLNSEPTDAHSLRNRLENLRRAGDNWILKWPDSVLRTVRAMLLLTHIVCAMLIFSFHYQTNSSSHDSETVLTFGSPKPWLTAETYRKSTWNGSENGTGKGMPNGMNSGFNLKYHFDGIFFWVFLIVTFATLLKWKIDLATKPASS